MKTVEPLSQLGASIFKTSRARCQTVFIKVGTCIRRSSRRVRIELDGQVLAESSAPTLVFETNLPTRFYLPRQDVRVPLRESELRTHCAYKGEARYWSVDGADDLVWGYESPLPDAAGLEGLVAFYDDRVSVIVDGVPRERARPF